MSNSTPMVFGQPSQGNVEQMPGNRARKTPDAYINIALPRTDGKDGKIDRGLRLYFDDESQKGLAEALQTPEGLAAFKEKLIVTCNIVTGQEKAAFDLGLG